MPPLESWVGVKTDCEHIKVILPQWYLEETHRRLADVLENTFKPLTDYVEELHEKFYAVFGPETHSDIVAYVSTGRTFEECVSKVEDFNGLVREINGMVNHRIFNLSISNLSIVRKECLPRNVISAKPRVLRNREYPPNRGEGGSPPVHARGARIDYRGTSEEPSELQSRNLQYV